MSGDTIAALVALLGALILVSSGLWRRQLATTKLLRLALIWAGIIALVWGAVTIGLRLQ